MKIAFKYWFGGGRKAIASELYEAKKEAREKYKSRSFVSGKTINIEWHHGFSVAEFPWWADSAWNLWAMTDQEHRLHPRSYHSWASKYDNNWLSRKLFACSPLGLYFWKYFVWYWWRGFSVLFVFSILAFNYLG